MNQDHINLQFKTNINCSGCIAKVTPFLNDAEGISHWEVDTNNKDKILSVESDGITEAEVMKKYKKLDLKLNCYISRNI